MKILIECWLLDGLKGLVGGPEEVKEKELHHPMKIPVRVSNPSPGARYVMFAYNSWCKSIF
jgi:hypothetical protein